MSYVQNGLRIGMIWFIIRQICFFQQRYSFDGSSSAVDFERSIFVIFDDMRKMDIYIIFSLSILSKNRNNNEYTDNVNVSSF